MLPAILTRLKWLSSHSLSSQTWKSDCVRKPTSTIWRETDCTCVLQLTPKGDLNMGSTHDPAKMRHRRTSLFASSLASYGITPDTLDHHTQHLSRLKVVSLVSQNSEEGGQGNSMRGHRYVLCVDEDCCIVFPRLRRGTRKLVPSR